MKWFFVPVKLEMLHFKKKVVVTIYYARAPKITVVFAQPKKKHIKIWCELVQNLTFHFESKIMFLLVGYIIRLKVCPAQNFLAIKVELRILGEKTLAYQIASFQKQKNWECILPKISINISRQINLESTIPSILTSSFPLSTFSILN